MPSEVFTTQASNWSSVPIKNMGLTIAGTPLETVLTGFRAELEHAGIRRVQPVFYLSTEWGVPFDTVAIAIPFYLARVELTELHAQRVGHVEGRSRADILRYLRHEMGHVMNYAYRLYEQEEWIKLFGSIDQPYEEEYPLEPFSRRHVRHLPGWYAQKHPDEDWAETFAVWMTPGLDWRAEYADWPVALAKLEYCERTMAALKERDPLVTAADLDEDVGDMKESLDQFYGQLATEASSFPVNLDGVLRSLFEDLGHPEGHPDSIRQPASDLIRRLEPELMADVYRWTGYFPERARPLLRHLARRADELNQVYPQDRELQATVALTALVTTLAMNHIQRGK
jgi:Putative zinc-binding metallo-peptidase